MTAYKFTYISAVVHQAGDNPIINDQSTTVTICDEAAGAFVSLTDSEGTTIKLDQDEFEIVANVARGMLECFDDKMPKRLNEIEESSVEPRISFDDRWHKAARDLLAVIHCDGGRHAGKVGFVQACKEAESIVRQLRSDDARSNSGEWTTENPTKGGIYWVQFDPGLAPQSVEVYRLDEDDVWRMRIIGHLSNTVSSCHVSSLKTAIWNGPISAPPFP